VDVSVIDEGQRLYW